MSALARGATGFVARAYMQLLTFAVTIVAIRWLAVAEFGAFAIAAAFMVLFRRLYYVGPYEYMLKTPAFAGLNGSCLLASAVIGLVSALVLVLVAAASSALFDTALVGALLLWLAPSLMLSICASWYEAHLLRQRALQRYYVYMVGAETIGAVAALAAFAAGLGVYALAVQIYGRLAALLCCHLFTRMEPIWGGADLKEVRTILTWSRSRYGTVIANFFSVYGSDLMLGALMSPAATGLFRAGNRIVSAVTDLFAQPLQKIAQTNVAARHAASLPSDGSWLGMFSSVAAIGFAALAGLAMLAPGLVPAVLGEPWRPAIPVVVIMCAVRALAILDATTVSQLVCNNRQAYVFQVQVATAIAVLTGAALFAQLGVAAVAAALGCVLFVQSAVICREAMRLTGVTAKIFARALANALTPAFCVIALILIIRPFMTESGPEWLRLTLLAGVGSAGAGLGLLLVRRSVLIAARTLAPPSPVEQTREELIPVT